MRRHLIGGCIVLIGACTVFAAEKDTKLAANTRQKKLTAKISVNYQDQILKDVFADISKQLEDAGVGSLSFKYDNGVSMNQHVTFQADMKTVAEVLDEMLKKNSLGYYVISKDKDRYDGWLFIKQGNERGWPAGQEPKGKAAPKAAAKAAPDPTEKPVDKPTDDPDKMEKAAASKLDFARSLLKDGKTERAKQRLHEIITQYPNTKAAEDAKKELEKLGQ